MKLQRLTWIVRKTLAESLLHDAPGVRVDAVGRRLGEMFDVYVRVEVMGSQRSQTITLNAPDGFWQWLRAAVGLPHRKQTVNVTAFALFPELKADHPYLYVETNYGSDSRGDAGEVRIE